MDTLAGRLTALWQSGISDKELGARAGLPSTTVNRWRLGKAVPFARDREVEQVSAVLGVGRDEAAAVIASSRNLQPAATGSAGGDLDGRVVALERAVAEIDAQLIARRQQGDELETLLLQAVEQVALLARYREEALAERQALRARVEILERSAGSAGTEPPRVAVPPKRAGRAARPVL